MPKLRGRAVGRVTIYRNTSCSPPYVAQGSSNQFQSPGIAVTVPDNSTTTFAATAETNAGRSVCSPAQGSGGTITYREVTP